MTGEGCQNVIYSLIRLEILIAKDEVTFHLLANNSQLLGIPIPMGFSITWSITSHWTTGRKTLL